MRVRPLLILTGLASSILGAGVVYLALSVPNDLRADALLQQARDDIQRGDGEKARENLARVVQQYPRTDAAAAATVALVSLGQKEREDLARAILVLRRQNEQQTAALRTLQQNVADLRSAAAKTITVPAPLPEPPPKASEEKKTPPQQKTTAKKKTTAKRTVKRPAPRRR